MAKPKTAKKRSWEPGKHPGGRPRKEVNEQLLRELAAIACTSDEMAVILGVSKDTLERNYMSVIEDGRALCRASLRRRQWELAMAGEKALLIFLGKNLLGQSDRQDLHHAGHISINISPEDAEL